MEEDIEILKDFLELREIYSSDSCRTSYLKTYQKAVKNLIARYKELEDYLPYIKEDYIPKSKVKEKIEELENQKHLYFEKQVIQGRIDLLQELLED